MAMIGSVGLVIDPISVFSVHVLPAFSVALKTSRSWATWFRWTCFCVVGALCWPDIHGVPWLVQTNSNTALHCGYAWWECYLWHWYSLSIFKLIRDQYMIWIYNNDGMGPSPLQVLVSVLVCKNEDKLLNRFPVICQVALLPPTTMFVEFKSHL